jgi:1-deoxy-D-xylulose-5-phosphate reductoisomerase
MRKIAILGASGSVGRQAAEVAQRRGYSVDLITGGRDSLGIESIARALRVKRAVMADADAASDLKMRLSDTDIAVYSGRDAILSAISESEADTVVNAILGEAGLMPTIEVIKSKKRLALANKESLVIAGDIVISEAKRCGAEIIPVDSEHSAIFQSLSAGKGSEIKSLILTASGGPFFGKSREELSRVTLADTLAHPTWKMGKKITVDSATLMNKGFEIIEAHHLFGVSAENIDVVIHRESILHSAVEYIDNTIVGQFSVPDMRACVQYAIDYPDRCRGIIEPLDLKKLGKMSFAEPDCEAFPLLSLAKRAISDGGAMPAVLNAADEYAVDAFLNGRISFADISRIVHEVYCAMPHAVGEICLEGIISMDREARERAKRAISR